MKEITIVIGDRMGKGQKVGVGIESVAGFRAIVIPGMAADMKLGDVMHKENADLGISFCGSGGAGALTAKNKYGYAERHGMRSADEGETAIAEGCKVLGFGFMDTEELGKRIATAYLKKYPRS
ncbi:SFCGS family glycine-rich protein [Orbaceae bacterium ESL0727]|nr:SFCGS family glycine-rich protein [Orbaceae bacterium ESL0727]